jgi:uncharacterized protein (TIGR02270 family)
MATSLRSFQVGIYEEHLEEASFLYEQRRALIKQSDVDWRYIGDFEERLEAHIDALVVGADLAVEVCRRRSDEGDAGELFAAVCVFCRRRGAAILANLLRGLDFSNVERVRSVGDALKYELPDDWRDSSLQAVRQGQGSIAALLGGVLGYRRTPGSDVLIEALHRVESRQQATILWALGRTRPGQAAMAIRSSLHSPEPDVRGAAIRAGLRMHDPEVWAQLLALTTTPPPFPIELGLAAGRSVVPTLIADATRAFSEESVMALGLLGDLSSVRALISLLPHEPLAPIVAEALFVITGAPLVVDVLLVDAIEEGELFEDEITVYRETGQLPTRPDGRPFGSVERKLSTNPAEWTAWLEANAARFRSDRRYRLGELYDPSTLLRCLLSDRYPKTWRGLAAEELLTRYAVDVPLEVDMPVAWQTRVLREVTVPVGEASAEVDPGLWYFGRRAV